MAVTKYPARDVPTQQLPVKEEECLVCEESYPADKLYCISKCTHRFCKDCLSNYIKTMVDTNKILQIGCLDSSCDSSGVADKICSFLFSQREYMLEIRYRRIRNAGLALKWNKKVCPNETCYSILQDVDEQYRSCNTCKINLCWKCNNLYHDDSPCNQSETVDFMNCMDKNKIIKCPRCSVNITKAEGCNHMRCAACSNEFCWICRKNYTPDHYSKFNPFGCPGLQFDEPAESSSARCCYKTRAYAFWVFIILFFPLVYVIFLLGMPTFYYLKRQRNIVKENMKKRANLHKFKADRGYSPDENIIVEEYKLRKEHSPGLKCFMCIVWGLIGIPFMVLALVITVAALPILPCYLVYKCCKKK
jgi:IBR domain, a half RING-finger domain